ncbi:2-acylglycerol O-acyltransferase 2-like [Paramacrobiotus metropolitanus]|uniref:2-acylglycerol O-acyltransferase 2-like n=1 Tax=Paramacrobiotus metropolitanus TaxID=2943436 RepID=UPI0024462876|nr:2-acylglycerol O-acyltransferase 2-like [Paramacrobiotus metropolitanus]
MWNQKLLVISWYYCTNIIFLCWGGWIIVYPVLIKLLFTNYFWIPLLLFAWMLIDDSQNQGGRSWRPLRNCSFTNYWYQYFSTALHVTTPQTITPDNNYIFACHPHGILATGVSGALISEGLGISQRLPGMRLHILVSRLVFWFPLFREMFLWGGCSSASKRNIKRIAEKSTGNVLVLIPGGAAEMFEAWPGRNTLVLENRKGFIRMALETGCHLVPVYSFGETDIFHQVFDNPTGSRLRNVQSWFASLTGFPLVIFYGCSKIFFWQPLKRPINVVVGKSIEVQKIAQPSQEEIDDLHGRYKEALWNLFEEHKAFYGFSNSHLEFI